MPRAVDNPVGKIWGIRIHGVTSERNDILKDISGLVAVIHRRGKYAEKPHYHIYYESNNDIKKDNLKRALKALDGWKDLLIDPKMYTFSTSSEYTLETYWKYVWDKDKGQELVCWNLPTEQLPIPVRSIDTIISHVIGGEGLIAKDVSALVTKPKPKTTEEKMQKFANYVYECYKEDPDAYLDERYVINLLIEYSKGGFNDNAAGQYVRFAIYYVCEQLGESMKTRKAVMKNLWTERVLKRFF